MCIRDSVITDKKNSEEAISFAKEWLRSINEKESIVTSEECKFCHSESVSEDVEIEIMTNGYFIAKMEGCPQ